jgi:hypothetical protein
MTYFFSRQRNEDNLDLSLEWKIVDSSRYTEDGLRQVFKTLKSQGFFEVTHWGSTTVAIQETGEFNIAYKKWEDDPTEQARQEWIEKAKAVRDVYRSCPFPEAQAAAKALDKFLAEVIGQPAPALGS